jgi:hypothetical protein
MKSLVAAERERRRAAEREAAKILTPEQELAKLIKDQERDDKNQKVRWYNKDKGFELYSLDEMSARYGDYHQSIDLDQYV